MSLSGNTLEADEEVAEVTPDGAAAGSIKSRTAPSTAQSDRAHLVPGPQQPASWVDRVEAFLSRLSTRDNFWHRIFSLLFLPLAFWSGIRMRQSGREAMHDHGASFTAVLPFK